MADDRRALTYVEVDVDYCGLTYGVAPCTAELGVTGTIKCFNTLVTCQDRANFDNQPATLRFAMPTAYLPADIEAIPSIRDVSVTPATISLGENLGERGTLSVSFGDHRWSDTGAGFDKYHAERGYNPFDQGTFFGKFRARQPFLRGRPIRLVRGFLGQSIAEMETRHYVIESFDGPTPEGVYTLTAKDVLKLADGDRAKAPRLSNGFLAADIDDAAAAATLSPAGIGNAEYPASGYLAIGGKEIVAFTRSADALTLTGRGELGTAAQDHAAQDRVQVVIRYEAESPAVIIAELLETYAGVPPAYIPIAAWQNEIDSFYQRVMTATLAEPTGVNQLVSEIVEQAALAVWWSDTQQQIRLQVLRGIPTDAARFTPETFMEGSLATREQPDKRLSQVWTYFAQRNPLEGQEDPDNYRSSAATVDLEAETDYGTPAIKTIFSRWIPLGGRTVATRLNDIVLARFRDPPRRLSLRSLRGVADIVLGGGYRLEGWPFQDATGAGVSVPFQVTRLRPGPDVFEVEGEEVLFGSFDPDDLVNRSIILDVSTLNVNLRSIHDTLFPAPTDQDVLDGVNLTCFVETGVIIGSASTATPAFIVGDWPTDFPVTVRVIGRIQGKGGNGARGSTEGGDGNPGRPGGPALYTRHPITIADDGEIFGGAGGGGGGGNYFPFFGTNRWGGGGGGGAGQMPGAGGGPGNGGSQPGQPGTTELGGDGGNGSNSNAGRGGDGGDPGEAGAAGQNGNTTGGGPGGAAGAAVDGDSFVTVADTPDIRGPEIN